MIMNKAAYTDIGDVIGDVVKLIGDIIDIMDQLIKEEINMDPIIATVAKVVITAAASAIIDSISNSQEVLLLFRSTPNGQIFKLAYDRHLQSKNFKNLTNYKNHPQKIEFCLRFTSNIKKLFCSIFKML